jgi:hypothetical protein
VFVLALMTVALLPAAAQAHYPTPDVYPLGAKPGWFEESLGPNANCNTTFGEADLVYEMAYTQPEFGLTLGGEGQCVRHWGEFSEEGLPLGVDCRSLVQHWEVGTNHPGQYRSSFRCFVAVNNGGCNRRQTHASPIPGDPGFLEDTGWVRTRGTGPEDCRSELAGWPDQPDLGPSPPDPGRVFGWRRREVDRNKRKGTAKITATAVVPGLVTLQLSPHYKRQPSKRVESAGGEVKVKIVPKGVIRKSLLEKGRARVEVVGTFTPDDGSDPVSADIAVRLAMKR